MQVTETQEDITQMTDTQLVEYTAEQDEVTPLENELAHRLEIYIATYGDMWLGD